MRLNPGTTLGPYEIVAPLGAGGMGEVYRAKDTRLGRDVAIKVLPEHLTSNPEVRARFEREARTVSSLNHPHICTLHDVGREGENEYLVMELVEGETLAQRLTRGPLPLPELLRIGVQIADALDRAHRAGIVHRDFKPGNVMLAKMGAKLMDFGLARVTGLGGTAAGSGITMAHLTQSPTMASPLTAEGTLVGTFLYMSPEQLEGREPDVRSDLWALGCVLFEMATGKRAFEGKSQASLIGAVMHTTPAPASSITPSLPPALESLIGACLTKDPEERIQTAHDVKLQLTWISQPASQMGAPAVGVAPAKRSARREPLAWGVAVLAIAAAAFFAWRSFGAKGGIGTQQLRFNVPIPNGVLAQSMPRVSPDGSRIAFTASDSLGRTVIWLRPLNSLAANPIPSTEGARPPFWSPDGRYLAFVAGGKLKRIPVAGGPAEVICDAPTGSDGSWSKDDVILFDGSDADPIYRVNASGGARAVAVPGDSVNQVGWPEFLPDGKHFLYMHISATGSKLMVGSLGGAKPKELPLAGSRTEYTREGYVLFARDRALFAQRFDARALKVVGEAFPIAEDLPTSASGVANFSVSDNGVLVYRATGTLMSRLVWIDRSGRQLGEVGSPANYRAPALSPDGNRVAVRAVDPGDDNLDIWVIDMARHTTSRFTYDAGDDGNPVWSPDGSKILWTSFRANQQGIYVKASNGVGADERLALAPGDGAITQWSPHGLLGHFSTPGTPYDVFKFTLDGGANALTPFLNSKFVEQRAYGSPDGRWVAYESDESGRPEIYVVPFQGTDGKWQISPRGGTDPQWSADGRELFFLAADGSFTSVPIVPGAGFDFGLPQPLYRVQVEQSRRRNVYCPAKDGQRFLWMLPLSDSGTPMTVMVNWRAGLGRK